MKTPSGKYVFLALVSLALGIGLIAAAPAQAGIIYSGPINQVITPQNIDLNEEIEFPLPGGYDLNPNGGAAEFNINVYRAAATNFPVTIDAGFLGNIDLNLTLDGQAAGYVNLIESSGNYFIGSYATIQVQTGLLGILYPVEIPVINNFVKNANIGLGLPAPLVPLDKETELAGWLGFDIGGFEARVHLEGTSTSFLGTNPIPSQNHGPLGGFQDMEGYAGFQFEDTDGTHYGWLRVYLDYDDTNHIINSLTIKDYAYETMAGQTIVAGAVPLPASVLLLGSGLMGLGLLGWRRKAKG